MDLKIRIRPAKPEDAEKLLAIYAPYVEQTAITFEYEVPTLEDFLLKCDGGFDDIGRIDIQQRRGVIRDCGADMYHMQHLLSLCCV